MLAGILQVLAVPDGHQVITPDRRCYAPHLGASLALALRLDRARAVFPHAEAVEAAEGLLAVLDADERGPCVLSPAQLDVLTRAMDGATPYCRRRPASTRSSTLRSGPPTPGVGAHMAPEHSEPARHSALAPTPTVRRPAVSVASSVYAVYGVVIAPPQDYAVLDTALEAQTAEPGSPDPESVRVQLFTVGDSKHIILGGIRGAGAQRVPAPGRPRRQPRMERRPARPHREPGAWRPVRPDLDSRARPELNTP
ncbi:hypothetical protein [Streptomyces mirabilis]|uniref:hypothetical protein n=1 Tax=Streptomyces mirabilis TaxID=68239 RepID=UPI0032462E50